MPVSEAPSEQPAGNDRFGALVVGVWLALAALFSAVVGIDVFDKLSKISGADPPIEEGKITALWFDFSASQDLLVVLLAATAGVLGALVSAGWAGSVHYANQQFGSSWVPWYFVRVVVGGVLGAIVVLAVVAGIIAGGTATAEVEPAGVAVTGFIIGLASKKAMDKLGELIDVIFAKGSGQQATTAKLRAISAWAASGLITQDQAVTMVQSVVDAEDDDA